MLKVNFILELLHGLNEYGGIFLAGKPSSLKNTSISYFINKLGAKTLKTVYCFDSSITCF
jgi:hypothetical protein